MKTEGQSRRPAPECLLRRPLAFLTAGARAGDVVDFILGTLGIPALENSKHGGFQGCSGELAFHAERFKAPSPVEPFLHTTMILRLDDYIWIAMAAAITPTTAEQPQPATSQAATVRVTPTTYSSRAATTSNHSSNQRASNTYNLKLPSSNS